MKLVHAYPDAEELGRVYRPHLAIHAAPKAFAKALAGLKPRRARAWREDRPRTRLSRLVGKARPQPGDVNLARSWCGCAAIFADDAIICNGAGNYSGWIHRFYRFRRFTTQMGRSAGSMGYGMPAAVAMKALHPQRTVVAINGDGDFLMNGQEFATAVQYGSADHRAVAATTASRHHPHASGARISRPDQRRPIWSIRTSPPMARRSAALA